MSTHAGPAKNILVIYTDQWRWDALRCLGSEVHTPHIDALAEQGLLFDHAFVQSPVCMPSRVSMLTSSYPSTLGITQMGVPVPPQTQTVASVLRARGWRTANLGKLHFQPHANRDHRGEHPGYGFDTLRLSEEPGAYDDDYSTWLESIDPELACRLRKEVPPRAQTWRDAMGLEIEPASVARDDYADVLAFPGDEGLTHSAWVADETIGHLRSLTPGQSSLTVASFFSPHAPYLVPQRFLDLYNREELAIPQLPSQERRRDDGSDIDDEMLRTVRHGYFAAISEVDHHIGRILGELDALGRADDTLVILTSDHGEWLGEGGRFGKGYPADDAVSRVPLMMRWPAGIESPGRRVETIVEALDIVPTVLSAAAVPIPTRMQGYSLMDAFTERDPGRPEVAVTEHLGWRSVRSRDHRYVVHKDGTERLFDVGPGAGELAVEGSPAILAEHRRMLLHRMLAAERSLPATWAY